VGQRLRRHYPIFTDNMYCDGAGVAYTLTAFTPAIKDGSKRDLTRRLQDGNRELPDPVDSVRGIDKYFLSLGDVVISSDWTQRASKAGEERSRATRCMVLWAAITARLAGSTSPCAILCTWCH
jgi:hypothetical protein